MLEKVVEEPLQATDTDKKDEKAEVVSRPIFSKNISHSQGPPGHLKELVSAVIDDLAESMVESQRGRDGELTLLNLHGRSRVPDKPRGQCPTCGSTKIVRDLPVRCKNSASDGNLSIHFDTPPDETTPKECPSAGLLADVCSDCGHVELKVQNIQDCLSSCKI